MFVLRRFLCFAANRYTNAASAWTTRPTEIAAKIHTLSLCSAVRLCPPRTSTLGLAPYLFARTKRDVPCEELWSTGSLLPNTRYAAWQTDRQFFVDFPVSSVRKAGHLSYFNFRVSPHPHAFLCPRRCSGRCCRSGDRVLGEEGRGV